MKERRFVMAAMALVALVVNARTSCCQESLEDQDPKEKAKEYFERAVVLFKAGDVEGALESFLTSYEARPHEKVKLNIGLCLYKLGRYAEAGNALNDFLSAEGENSREETVKQVQGVLDEIRARTGLIQVEVDEEDAAVEIDGESFGQGAASSAIHVEPGEHQVKIETQDGIMWSGKVEVKAGETRVVSVTMAVGKAPEKKKKSAEAPEKESQGAGPAPAVGGKKPARSLFYASLALAAASALAGAICGGMAMQKAGEVDDLDRGCREDGCDTNLTLHDVYVDKREGLYSSTENLGNASTALFAAAGVFAVASLASLLVWRLHGREKPSKAGHLLIPPGVEGLAWSVEF